MNPWETLVLIFGGNLALLAAVAWLARSLVSQLIAKDLERFKADLASASIVAAERLKHELQLAAQEHQALISRLHERRAQVVAETYGLFVEAHWAAQDFVSPMKWAGEPDKRQKYATAMNKAAEFYRYFDKNRIYLPHELCDRLEHFVRDMRKTVIGFGVYVRLDEAAMPDHAIEKKHQAWMQASEYFDAEVPKDRAALEQELRGIIGGIARTGN
jgi:hypothetical protein